MTTFGQDVGTRAGELEAIRSFIMNAQIDNSKAAGLRDAFIKRWEDMSWFDQTFPSQSIYDEMKNRENQFWIANHPVAEQESAARIVRDNRLDPRQTSGGVLPNDARLEHVESPDIARLDEQIEEAKPFFELPTWFGPAVVVTVLGGVAFGIAKIVTSFNPASLLAKFSK